MPIVPINNIDPIRYSVTKAIMDCFWRIPHILRTAKEHFFPVSESLED